MAKVLVQIVTWNSRRFISDCLESLETQTYRDFSAMVIDNGSTDGTVKFVRDTFPTVSVLENSKNLGYAKANNQGIKMCRGEYVLVLNPDALLDSNFLETIITFADAHPRGASFGGKTYKLSRQAIDDRDQGGLHEVVPSETIDSTGLVLTHSREALNRGEGERDENQFERTEEVFGHSGSCVLFRKSALDEAAVRGEYFDQDFFAYKEDVDLAWRLRLYGWESWYIPAAVAFHYRTYSKSRNKSLLGSLKKRRSESRFLRQLSLRNHYLMLIKNEHAFNVVTGLPWLMWQTFKMAVFVLFFEPFQFRTVISIISMVPSTMSKRRVIATHRSAAPRDIRRWFIH